MEQSATSFLFVRLWEDLKKQITQLKPKVRQKGCKSRKQRHSNPEEVLRTSSNTTTNFQHQSAFSDHNTSNGKNNSSPDITSN
jgi:hypothetical protein